jgi:hypothetical protein
MNDAEDIDQMTPEVCQEIASCADFLLPIARASKGWPLEVQAWLIAIRETSLKRAAQMTGTLQ